MLYFSRRTDTIIHNITYKEIGENRKSGKSKKNNKSNKSSYTALQIQVLTAKTQSPLLIELPLLGYSVYLDLVSFNLKKGSDWTDCDYWAYYRFINHPAKSAIKQANIEKNRQEIYYNSTKHFCRSIFENKLKENGYQIGLKNINDSLKKIEYIDISSYINYINQDEIQIIGLKNKTFDIYYFCDYGCKPINLTIKNQNSYTPYSQWDNWSEENNSTVTFQNDTCSIRANGTTPDRNILFGGKIATKRGGTLLPDDYLPNISKKKKRIK